MNPTKNSIDTHKQENMANYSLVDNIVLTHLELQLNYYVIINYFEILCIYIFFYY